MIVVIRRIARQSLKYENLRGRRTMSVICSRCSGEVFLLDLFRWAAKVVGYVFTECLRRIRTSRDYIVTWRRYGPFVRRDWTQQTQARRGVRIDDTRCSQFARIRA